MLASEVDHLLENAVWSVQSRDDWRAVLDRLPTPIYATDSDGAVTYWNEACVKFAGRQPELGKDRWCVTWQLYSATGARILHEDCPMAEAIKKKRNVRGKVAIALRPDGSRRAFTPYPTPLFDERGNLTGAINLLIDVSDEQAAALDEQAVRCRRLAREMPTKDVAALLTKMADEYRATAAALRTSQT